MSETSADEKKQDGVVALQAGDFVQAQKLLYEALSETSNSEAQGELYYFIGLAHLYGGKSEEAKDVLSKALKILGDMPEVYLALGDCWLNDEAVEEAERWYQKGLSVAPNDYSLLFSLGRAYTVDRRYDEAEAILMKAIAYADASLVEEPKSYLAAVLAEKAEMAFKREDFGSAKDLCQRALAFADDNSKAQATLEQIQQREKDLSLPDTVDILRGKRGFGSVKWDDIDEAEFKEITQAISDMQVESLREIYKYLEKHGYRKQASCLSLAFPQLPKIEPLAADTKKAFWTDLRVLAWGIFWLGFVWWGLS